jgi:hypothetical protein
MTTDQLAEHLFDVANQFSRGAAWLIDRDEKAQVATIDLRAGRKAKASAAYASARAYFSAGMSLLDDSDWGSRYELTFSLWVERAECEFLTRNFDTAEQLIAALLQRGASKVDQAAVYHLKIQLHVRQSQNPQAVDSALTSPRHWHRYAHPDRGRSGRIRDGLAKSERASIELPVLPLMTVQTAGRLRPSPSLLPAYFPTFLKLPDGLSHAR